MRFGNSDANLKFLASRISEFYFNYEEAFISTLVANADGGHHLPHKTFIATLLLPCGDLNGKIQKFTGNMEFGPVDKNEHLTMAIHAFTHFMAVYTQKTIVLCDLQGTIHSPSSLDVLEDPNTFYRNV